MLAVDYKIQKYLKLKDRLDNPINEGDRVQLKDGYNYRKGAWFNLATRTGTVLGGVNYRGRDCVRVIWDGRKTYETYNRDLLKRISGKEKVNEE